MRKLLVAGNWKMNGSGAANSALIEAVVAGRPADDNVELLVCPPFPYLAAVSAALQGSGIALGAQTVSEHDKGAYTGEVSAAMLKEGGEWTEVSWEDALAKAAEVLSAAAGNSGYLLSPSATVEEGYLTAQIAEHLGSANIDHRVRRRDFSDQDNDPLFPYLGTDIAGIEEQDSIFLVGSSLRREVPILAHRVRKAALNGAAVSIAAARPEEYFFDIANQLSGSGLVDMVIIASFKANFWIAFAAATTLILGAAYTLWMVKRVVYGEVANDKVAALTDLNGREFFVLAVLAVSVLLLGVWPAPLVDMSRVQKSQKQ